MAQRPSGAGLLRGREAVQRHNFIGRVRRVMESFPNRISHRRVRQRRQHKRGEQADTEERRGLASLCPATGLSIRGRCRVQDTLTQSIGQSRQGVRAAQQSGLVREVRIVRIEAVLSHVAPPRRLVAECGTIFRARNDTGWRRCSEIRRGLRRSRQRSSLPRFSRRRLPLVRAAGV